MKCLAVGFTAWLRSQRRAPAGLPRRARSNCDHNPAGVGTKQLQREAPAGSPCAPVWPVMFPLAAHEIHPPSAGSSGGSTRVYGSEGLAVIAGLVNFCRVISFLKKCGQQLAGRGEGPCWVHPAGGLVRTGLGEGGRGETEGAGPEITTRSDQHVAAPRLNPAPALSTLRP